LIDSTVLIDHLRGRREAIELLAALGPGAAHGSDISRVEVLAGMRPPEEPITRVLLSLLRWHPVDGEVAEHAGALGRQWLPSHSGIDAPDLAIAATAQILGLPLYTTNVRHFPMFPGLQPAY
jgi:predicted nucleic acid-binding protein